jgi:hypothetical protein
MALAMDISSPLGAIKMEATSMPGPWHHSLDRNDLDSQFLQPPSRTSARSFNFKELSMKKSNPDYFSFKPARGSSPTQSLAVDLSQNFHIDQRSDFLAQTSYVSPLTHRSPQLPTPRRSLFTTSFFGSKSNRRYLLAKITASAYTA